VFELVYIFTSVGELGTDDATGALAGGGIGIELFLFLNSSNIFVFNFV